MFARFVAALSRFLASIGNDLYHSIPGILNFGEQVIRWPFSVVFGNGASRPHFAPQVTKSDVVEDFLHARRSAAAVHTLDRDGIDSVLRFCAAHREDRPTTPLPKNLDPAVRVALRTMDDAALRAIATAPIGKVRKFIDGVPHAIHGVPEIVKNNAAPEAEQLPPPGMTEHQRILWKIKAQLEKTKASEPFRAVKP